MFATRNSSLRKGAVLIAGGGVYSITAYLTYMYLYEPPPVNTASSGKGGERGCTSCVHNPMRTQQFENVAACYDTSIGRDEFFMGINLLRRSLLYFHAKGTCLEVGAGTARNVPYYPNETRVVLTDQSGQMLEQARNKVKGNQRFAIIQGDATRLALPNQAFDTVVDTFGLCSYDDPVTVLREMVRVCKPNGKILLLEHGRSHSWQWVSDHLDKYADRHASIWGCVWNRDLDELLHKVSDVMEIQVLHRWHFGTTYYIVCRPKSPPPST